MNFRKFSLLSVLLLTGLVLALSSCQDKDLNEEMNNDLDGDWEATSFMWEDNVERITGDITENLLSFQKTEIDQGIMDWKIITTLMTLEIENGIYTLYNDGSRLTYGTYKFDLEYEDDILTIDLVEGGEAFTLKAEKK